MKKNKVFLFLLIIIFVMPICAFACDEKKINDVPYTNSLKTTSEVFDDINSAKRQMISDVELKMELSSTVTFQFFATKHNEYSSKKMVEKSSIVLGRNSDNPSISTFNTKKYEDDVLKNSEQTTYIKQVSNQYQTIANCYVLSQEYDNGQEDNIISKKYSRQEYNSTIITLQSLYNKIVLDINSNCVDSVLEKTFEGVNYYKMTSDIEGLEELNDSFKTQENISSNPQVFYKSSENDYVVSFNCEYGLMETEGSTYIKHFALNYKIQNENREKYLEVSVSVSLEKYGDKVSIVDIEDKGEYTANTFIDCMKQDLSYCVYNTEDDVKYSVLQIKKSTQDENSDAINYFDYSVKKEGSGDPQYYYLSGFYNTTSKKIEYKTYLLNVNNNKKEERNDFDFKWLLFDFNFKYFGKNQQENNLYYQFGDETSYIKVRVDENFDIKTIETKKETDITELLIQSYGISNKINLITDIANFEEITSEGNN